MDLQIIIEGASHHLLLTLPSSFPLPCRPPSSLAGGDRCAICPPPVPALTRLHWGSFRLNSAPSGSSPPLPHRQPPPFLVAPATGSGIRFPRALIQGPLTGGRWSSPPPRSLAHLLSSRRPRSATSPPMAVPPPLPRPHPLYKVVGNGIFLGPRQPRTLKP